LRADGCFCERLKDGGSVQHLQVIYAAPGQGLRLRGALGPLQTEGVDGTLTWMLKPGEGGTTVTLSYVLGGYVRSGMEQWAPKVDRVLDEQLTVLSSIGSDRRRTAGVRHLFRRISRPAHRGGDIRRLGPTASGARQL
jgi:hypothetical protein